MSKTKIICTIGPASSNEEILTSMCLAGMDVARLNFSHDTHEEQVRKMNLIKTVRDKLNFPIGIMLDTKGPEYRIGTFENHKVTVKEGDAFTFTIDEVVGNEHRVSVNYKDLINELNIGDIILVNNGLVIFEVQRMTDKDALCLVKSGGELSDRKSMNFPNHSMKGTFLSEQDKADLLLGIQNKVDVVAASFVSNKQDIQDMRNYLDEKGGKDIKLIAKIENRDGVNNVEEICQIADGIMVARGDLGVEIPFVEVPVVQKYLIKKCRNLGKIVITATEMLESMIKNPRPTRAEATDVANAIYDGSTALMLSGESAAGKYPVEAVRNMAKIVDFTEKHIDYNEKYR